MLKPKLFNAEDFTERVRAIVRAIPKGQVMSYGQIATALGAPRYSRQVAKVMANNYLPDVPCHRVIRSDGQLGGYNRGGIEQKRTLLLNEGYVL
ncbi:MGMT family protein [Patescibacteria group bacterium]|nr:MGMT family protein [Patescibacteria group bacterium]